MQNGPFDTSLWAPLENSVDILTDQYKLFKYMVKYLYFYILFFL